MALSPEIQFNPVPIGRIIVGGSCTECEDDPAAGADSAAIEDRVSLSGPGPAADAEIEGETPVAEPAGSPGPQLVGDEQLTQEELRQVQQLRARDREVRAHEQAHKAAAGPHAQGGPTFEYTTGPDGQRYAVSGEVQIDTSEVPDNPQATIAKAQTIRRAALAPADPSPQDRRVAASATAMETRARQQLQEERTEAARETRDDGAPENEAAPDVPESNSQKVEPPVTGPARHIARFEDGSTPEPARLLSRLA